MARNVAVRHYRGLLANMPALLDGELGFATDTNQLYIGSGSGNVLINSSGGSGNSVQATVDFGIPPGDVITEDTTAKATVAAAWVTAISVLICTVTQSVDHDPDDVGVEQIEASAGNIVPGVGFDVIAWAPNGTWGRYTVNIRG